MKHNDLVIKKAKEIISEFESNGLSFEDARKSSEIAVKLMLNVGLYPAYQSIYQKTLNCLSDKNFDLK